jgi:hypothetical protein
MPAAIAGAVGWRGAGAAKPQSGEGMEERGDVYTARGGRTLHQPNGLGCSKLGQMHKEGVQNVGRPL